jgi:hypothetical protein
MCTSYYLEQCRLSRGTSHSAWERGLFSWGAGAGAGHGGFDSCEAIAELIALLLQPDNQLAQASNVFAGER